MLLPDNVHPELSIYYNGAVVFKELNENPRQKILDLYTNVKKKHDLTFSMFILSLDWLYLIEVAEIDREGVIKKCF